MIGSRKRATPPVAAPAAVEPAPVVRTAAVVEAELFPAREAAAAAGHDLAAAREAYSHALDVGQEAALTARQALTEAEVGHEVAARAVQRLEAERDQLARVEAEASTAAERARIREEAESAVARYREAFIEHYPAIVAMARTLIRMEAEASLAREAALNLGIVVEGPDDFRALPARPRQVLATEVRSLWINPWSRSPFDDDAQERILPKPDGGGLFPAEVMKDGRTRPPIDVTEKQPFEFVTAIPGRDAKPAVRLAEGLRLPPMIAGDLAAWEPLSGASPSKVLKLLDKREAEGDAGLAEDLNPKTGRRALGPPVDVTGK